MTYEEILKEYRETGKEKKCDKQSEVVLGLIDYEGLGGS
jgi:hypothetical protein